MRHDAELGLHTGPALHVARGKIPVDAPHARLAETWRSRRRFARACLWDVLSASIRTARSGVSIGHSRIPPAPACHSAPARARAHASLPPGSWSFPPGRPCRCRCGRAQPPPSASRHRRSAFMVSPGGVSRQSRQILRRPGHKAQENVRDPAAFPRSRSRRARPAVSRASRPPRPATPRPPAETGAARRHRPRQATARSRRIGQILPHHQRVHRGPCGRMPEGAGQAAHGAESRPASRSRRPAYWSPRRNCTASPRTPSRAPSPANAPAWRGRRPGPRAAPAVM